MKLSPHLRVCTNFLKAEVAARFDRDLHVTTSALLWYAACTMLESTECPRRSTSGKVRNIFVVKTGRAILLLEALPAQLKPLTEFENRLVISAFLRSAAELMKNSCLRFLTE